MGIQGANNARVEPQLTLEDMVQIADATGNFATGLALVVGGIWAYYNFVLTRSGAWNLQLLVEHEVKPYNEKSCLLILYVLLNNVGKVKIEPGQRGCELTIKQLPDDLDNHHTLSWEGSENIVVDKLDLIHRRAGDEFPEYEIEPGSSYKEICAIILPRETLIMTETRFWWKDNKDTITNYSIFKITAEEQSSVPFEILGDKTPEPRETLSFASEQWLVGRLSALGGKLQDVLTRLNT